MNDETYPGNLELSKFFNFGPAPTRELPPAFDDACKKCREPMQPLECVYTTNVKPFATFYCEACKLQLLLFDAPVTPLLVWSDSFKWCTNFGEFIAHEIKEREHKREVRALRYKEGQSGAT